MTSGQREQRGKALSRSCGICAYCGKPLSEGQPQYAHRIANTQMNRELYGSFFIDHTLNGEMVCSLGCNQSMNIGYNKGKVLGLLADILLFEIRKHTYGKD